MAILSDINNIIQRMDAARFQQFGDELLRKIYHPINIESRGTEIGQSKTIKGSPDTIFTLPTGMVFIEYTTQSSSSKSKFFNKLKNDIESCLNEQKTNIPTDKIREIVIFANQRISIDTQEKLTAQLKSKKNGIELTFFSIDDISTRIKDYPGLMKDYLGISAQPCLIEIDTFINKFSNSRLSFPIPLNNTYFENEVLPVSTGIEELKKNDIILISGNTGMGKTRYAIEVAKAYTENTGTKLLVIEERNRNAKEILDDIDFNTPHLFLVDDANRTSVWEETIEYYSGSPNKNIKIIATIRNYALESTMKKCAVIKGFTHLPIPDSDEKLIKNILISFGITSQLWHERIISITRRNIRLAVMCAQIALAGNGYEGLINVESIYDAYYAPAVKEILTNEEKRVLIKVMAVISFYKVVDLEEKALLQQIKKIFGIAEDEFIATAHTLDKLECIDISEGIASIPDQNFGNYVFYQCFFVLKELSLSNLIENLYHRQERLTDTLYSVINCFQNDSVTEYLKSSVAEAWDSISELSEEGNDKNCFMEQFGNIIPYKTFLYIKNLIEKPCTKEDNLTIQVHDNVISILSHFYLSDDTEMGYALYYLVKYIEINPQKFEKALNMVSERWVFSKNDYLTSYNRITTLIDTLITIAQESNAGLRFASRILPQFLKFSYRITGIEGRKIIIGRYPVSITDELILNRMKVWEWIVKNIADIDQQLFTEELYTEYYDVESVARELVLKEISYLNQVIEKMDIKGNYNLCCSLRELSKRVKNITGEKCIVIGWENANELYLLNCQITGKRNQSGRKSTEEEKENLRTIINGKSHEELKELIEKIVQIARIENTGERLRVSYIVEGLIQQDINTAMQIWQYVISKGYQHISSRILYAYINAGYDIPSITQFIKEQKVQEMSNMILDFVCTIENPSIYITVNELHNALVNCDAICYDLCFIVNKYFAAEKQREGMRMAMSAILYRTRRKKDISDTEEFLLQFCQNNHSKLKLVEKVYIHGVTQNNTFDYKNKLIKEILSLDSTFWLTCYKNIKRFTKATGAMPYKYIWELPNHSQIIETTLLYYADKTFIPYDEEENLFSFFYNIKGEEAADFIDCMITRHCKNRTISSLLFRIVISCMGDSRVRHYITFISNNENIDDFVLLETRPRTMYGGESFAAAVKANIDFISELSERVSSLKKIKYIEHLNHLTNIKDNLTKEYNRELKRGHRNRLYNL